MLRELLCVHRTYGDEDARGRKYSNESRSFGTMMGRQTFSVENSIEEKLFTNACCMLQIVDIKQAQVV